MRMMRFIMPMLSVALLASCTTPSSSLQQTQSDPSRYHGDRRAFPNEMTPAPGRRVFLFSPKHLAWGAYEADGTLVGYGRASGGSDWCKALGRPCRTPAGVFSVKSKGEYECYSSKYPLPKGGAHMPYCMFFFGGYAIHGAPPGYVPDYNASHGCIRITTNAARWLRDNFMQIGTRVQVTSY